MDGAVAFLISSTVTILMLGTLKMQLLVFFNSFFIELPNGFL